MLVLGRVIGNPYNGYKPLLLGWWDSLWYGNNGSEFRPQKDQPLLPGFHYFSVGFREDNNHPVGRVLITQLVWPLPAINGVIWSYNPYKLSFRSIFLRRFLWWKKDLAKWFIIFHHPRFPWNMGSHFPCNHHHLGKIGPVWGRDEI